MSEQITTEAHLTIIDTNDVESITVEYARNQSTSTPPDANTGGWSTTRPTWAQGYYIWQRTRIHKTGTAASADTFGAAVCLTGSAGTNSYTWIRYGTNSSGANMTATPTASTTYIGIYTGTSSSAPTSASSYTWSKFVGEKGETGATGPTGATGSTGATGPTGPEAVVTIIPSNVNWEAGTATLTATLRVNGTITTPSTYKWTKGTSTDSLGTSSTLTLNGSTNKLDSTYNCTVTW